MISLAVTDQGPLTQIDDIYLILCSVYKFLFLLFLFF
jgi:hypothetical protein